MNDQTEFRRFVGVLIFIELHRRLLGGQFGSIPKPLSEYAFAEGAYSLDAPEVLPAGGSRWMDVDPELGLPVQIMVTRNGEAVA